MTKYDYPPEIAGDPDKMKKYRRDMRRNRTPEEAAAAASLVQSTPRSSSNSRIPSPAQQPSEDGAGPNAISDYAEQLEAAGLQEDSILGLGYGFSVEKRPSVEQMLGKYTKRWNERPDKFRFLNDRVIIFGPVPVQVQ